MYIYVHICIYYICTHIPHVCVFKYLYILVYNMYTYIQSQVYAMTYLFVLIPLLTLSFRNVCTIPFSFTGKDKVGQDIA